MVSSPPPPRPDSSITRRFLRDIALLFGIPLVLLAALVLWWAPWESYAVPAGMSIFDVAKGTWDWDDADEFCVDNPHTIEFSSDSSVMIISREQPWLDTEGVEHRVAEYDIWEHSADRIRGRIRGETRLTESGEPVVWDLVLTSQDSYHWHRTDWAPSNFTKTVRRCEN